MTTTEKDNLYKFIGSNIGRYIKEVKGFSQTQFAEKIGMKRATLSNIIAGRQIVSLHLLIDIAKELNVEVGILMPSLNFFQSKKNIEDDILEKLLIEKGISSKSQAGIRNSIDQANKK